MQESRQCFRWEVFDGAPVIVFVMTHASRSPDAPQDAADKYKQEVEARDLDTEAPNHDWGSFSGAQAFWNSKVCHYLKSLARNPQDFKNA